MQWIAWLCSRGGDYYKDKVRQGYDQDLSEGAGAKGTQQHLYNARTARYMTATLGNYSFSDSQAILHKKHSRSWQIINLTFFDLGTHILHI